MNKPLDKIEIKCYDVSSEGCETTISDYSFTESIEDCREWWHDLDDEVKKLDIDLATVYNQYLGLLQLLVVEDKEKSRSLDEQYRKEVKKIQGEYKKLFPCMHWTLDAALKWARQELEER